MAWIERFAPSPTGFLHLGHAFSALTAWDLAQANGGQFLLRIEDIDNTRVRPEFEKAIYRDLEWLGLDWPKPVLCQSQNIPAYQAALQQLHDAGLTYTCICNRAAIKAASVTAILGPDGLVYPGTCRGRSISNGENTSIRLNMREAIKYLGGESYVNRLSFTDTANGEQTFKLTARTLIEKCGDIILARKGLGTSYHLSVVVDDAAQNITHVTRGMDLFEATQIHRILQALLDLATPTYHHHRLILDNVGKRLAKSDDSRAIQKYRDEGLSPSDIRQLIGFDNSTSQSSRTAV